MIRTGKQACDRVSPAGSRDQAVSWEEGKWNGDDVGRQETY